MIVILTFFQLTPMPVPKNYENAPVLSLSVTDSFSIKLQQQDNRHCVKSIRIRSFSGPYSVRMRENTDQKNSEYEYFSRSAFRGFHEDLILKHGTLIN